MRRYLNFVDTYLMFLTRLIAAVAVFGSIFGLLSGWLQPVARNWLGVSELLNRVEMIEKSLPSPAILEYDQHFSYMYGVCRMGDECVARYRVRRTEYGALCEFVGLSPYVIVMSGRYPGIHVAGSYDAPLGDWLDMSITFELNELGIVPGRAVYYSDQVYDCDSRRVTESSLPLSFDLLPPSVSDIPPR